MSWSTVKYYEIPFTAGVWDLIEYRQMREHFIQYIVPLDIFIHASYNLKYLYMLLCQTQSHKSQRFVKYRLRTNGNKVNANDHPPSNVITYHSIHSTFGSLHTCSNTFECLQMFSSRLHSHEDAFTSVQRFSIPACRYRSWKALALFQFSILAFRQRNG